MAFTDPVITPYAARMVGCLAREVAQLPKPPKNVGLRPGAQAPIMLSTNRDECCEGLAWVRATKVVHSSTQNWPSADVIPQGGCGTKLLAVTLEIGIVRCAPTKPAQKIPSGEEWNAVAEATYLDYIAMERAICCFLKGFRWLNLTSDWSPLGVDGNCVGGSIDFTYAIPPCACQDVESPS